MIVYPQASQVCCEKTSELVLGYLFIKLEVLFFERLTDFEVKITVTFFSENFAADSIEHASRLFTKNVQRFPGKTSGPEKNIVSRKQLCSPISVLSTSGWLFGWFEQLLITNCKPNTEFHSVAKMTKARNILKEFKFRKRHGSIFYYGFNNFIYLSITSPFFNKLH